ncbi:MAG: BLUF domain-containing protein [Gemmatimonadetes bacterium]|nr:BLUF domain-containing protein [Gemmatimonadota bacterium]
MLVRLIYASRAVDPIDQKMLDRIMEQSRSSNAEAGITGMLCACTDTSSFLQAIEGGRTQVNGVYADIVCDPRHEHVTLLAYDEIQERRFANWRMGRVDLSRVNPGLVLRHAEHPALDPMTLSSGQATALLVELAETLAGG